jgi:hypothetical protein
VCLETSGIYLLSKVYLFPTLGPGQLMPVLLRGQVRVLHISQRGLTRLGAAHVAVRGPV